MHERSGARNTIPSPDALIVHGPRPIEAFIPSTDPLPLLPLAPPLPLLVLLLAHEKRTGMQALPLPPPPPPPPPPPLLYSSQVGQVSYNIFVTLLWHAPPTNTRLCLNGLSMPEEWLVELPPAVAFW
jgi:hypothetical protein